MQAVAARSEVLNKQIDAQKQKIEVLRQALKNASESFEENDRRTQSWQIQLNNAEAALNDMERELKANNDALSEASDGYTDAEKSVLFGTKEVTVTPADFGLTQDGIKIEVTHAGNSLITGYLPSDDMRSVTFMLRDTDKTDAANNASDTATLKFSSASYNETSGNTLTIKIINKRTDTEKLQIDVPATVTYLSLIHISEPTRRS